MPVVTTGYATIPAIAPATVVESLTAVCQYSSDANRMVQRLSALGFVELTSGSRSEPHQSLDTRIPSRRTVIYQAVDDASNPALVVAKKSGTLNAR